MKFSSLSVIAPSFIFSKMKLSLLQLPSAMSLKTAIGTFILWHGVFLLILLGYTTCRMLTYVDGLPNEVNGIQSGKSAHRNTFLNFDLVALFTKIKTYEFAQDFKCPKDFVP